MAERLNALVLKTSKPSRVSRVQIPVSPPLFNLIPNPSYPNLGILNLYFLLLGD